MKRLVFLSLATAALLHAEDVRLETVTVSGTTLADVSGEEIKSADLAEALASKLPGISLVRRSGIANDIILRGQKKDNITVLIDGAKIFGACPNRMDPPTSHIVTQNVDEVTVIEGPYDVEHFGTLSGGVYITTIKPEAGQHGSVNLNVGSWNYRKAAVNVSGGNDMVRVLFGASYESSDQYKDGDGNTFADQVDNFIAEAQDPASVAGTAYLPAYRDKKAYQKKSYMGKIFVNVTEDQELRLEYTRNESDGVLYPTSKMDAIRDDSDIYNVQYTFNDLGRFSKTLTAQYYHTDVEHPMSIRYRKAFLMKGDVLSTLTTDTDGLRLKNVTELSNGMELTLGADGSRRNWDGIYKLNGIPMRYPSGQIKASIPDVDTDNVGLFAEFAHAAGKLEYTVGVRYDDTSVTPAGSEQENDYHAFSANIFATYTQTPNLQFFGGFGKSSRVPDARELYWYSSMGVPAGTPDLKQITNYEIDLGMENSYEHFSMKTKLFYSRLKDYIYYNAQNVNAMGGAYRSFQNIDAAIYGAEISGTYYAADSVYVDFGLAYQRGKKDRPLTVTEGPAAGTKQSDTDLAEIPPLKGNIALNYAYLPLSTARMEIVASDKWRHYDSDNGEQSIDAWATLNLKIDHNFGNGFEVILGVDNILDRTYAISNTYKDLTLIDDASNDEVMLMNEPGRYVYANLSYKF